jgi:hypothetical protein
LAGLIFLSPGDKLALRSTQAGMMVRAAPTRVIDAGSVARRCSARLRTMQRDLLMEG